MSEEKEKPITYTIKELVENPVLKPFSEYKNGVLMYEQQEKMDAGQLSSAKEKIKTLIDTDSYSESYIVPAYDQLVQAHERVEFVYVQLFNLANTKMEEIKKIVESSYISREEHKQEISILNQTITNLTEEVRELRKAKTPIEKKKKTADELNKELQEEREDLLRQYNT